MSTQKLALLHGTLDMMVLQTLADMGEVHGYGIARRIEVASEHEILLNQGTIHASLARLQRFFAILVALFAALGLILATLGIYGVISYTVTRQTQEIGIRMALGASRERVQIDVINRTLRLALIGIAVGAGASFVTARAIASMLFGTQPTDPATFAAMAILLTAVALIAGYIPARRASQTNPINALRNN